MSDGLPPQAIGRYSALYGRRRRGLGNFQIRITGDKELERALLAAIAAGRTLTPAFRRIMSEFHIIVDEAFRTGRAGTRRWKLNSPRYRRSRRKRGKGPLILTGAYRRSWTRRGARHNITRFGPRFLKLGTSNPLSNLLEYGAPNRNIPARPVLAAVTPTVRRRWAQLLAEHIGVAADPRAALQVRRQRRRRRSSQPRAA